MFFGSLFDPRHELFPPHAADLRKENPDCLPIYRCIFRIHHEQLDYILNLWAEICKIDDKIIDL
jgi:hypothetical protein